MVIAGATILSAQVRVVTPEPAAWETRAQDIYENRGLARIERIGQQWALTILCRGEHTTYLEPSSIDPTRFAKQTVSARYRYVERTREVQCLKPPCDPVTERRILLDRVTPLTPSAMQLQNAMERCEDATPR